jgi:preprotein translocase subunit SecE
MAEVQTSPGASNKDTALITLSVLVLLFGIGAFYWYEDQPLPLRLAMVVAGLAGGAALAWFSWYGREFWQFAQAARVELRKVVWPSREETIKTTYVVFIFAIVMGLFFWGLDWILTWLTRLLTGQPPA